MVWFLARRSLRRHRTRTLLLVTGVVVSGALLFDMTMLGEGLTTSFAAVLGRLGYEIRVVPRGVLPLSSDFLIPNASRLATRIASHPGVLWASPMIATQVYVSARGRRVTAVAYGLRPEVAGIVRVEDGTGAEGGLVVNAALSRTLGLRIGERVILASRVDPQTGAPSSAIALRVVGFGEFPFDLRGQRTLAAPLDALQSLVGVQDGASFLVVKVRRGTDPEVVRAWVDRTFPDVQALSIPSLLRAVRTQLRYFDHFSAILSGVSLVVAVLLVGTVLTLQLGGRLAELAALRAIGLARARLVLLVLLEGAVVAGVSMPLALGVGLLLSGPLDAILRAMPGVPQDLRFFVPTAQAAIRTVALLLAAGTLGAAYPAWVAGTLQIAATLHREVL